MNTLLPTGFTRNINIKIWFTDLFYSWSLSSTFKKKFWNIIKVNSKFDFFLLNINFYLISILMDDVLADFFITDIYIFKVFKEKPYNAIGEGIKLFLRNTNCVLFCEA